MILPVIASAEVGDYKKIECSTQSFFSANSCNECFEGGNIALNKPVSGLYDSWTNLNKTEQMFYDTEQKYPQIISLGSTETTFKLSPEKDSEFWKFLPNDTWTNSPGQTTKKEFVLPPGKRITFLDAALSAITFTNTKAKSSEYAALIKFPLVYRNVGNDGNESEAITHHECVAYKIASAAAIVTPPVQQPVVPKEVTRVKTGPETFLFLALSLIIAALIALTRRRSRV
jgi:hypothetical protein